MSQHEALVEKLLSLSQALGAKARVRILLWLWNEEGTGQLTMTELAENLDMSLGSVSHHVGILKAAGHVKVEEVGRLRYVKLGDINWVLGKILESFEGEENDDEAS